jgi:hypothetical protein
MSAAPSTASAADDPARAFCLKKYQELFCKIFLQHPHVPISPGVEGDDVKREPSEDMRDEMHSVNSDELTTEQKADIESRANAYAVEVERCTYEICAEIGKDGRTQAGPKYK